jgi:hypothetical protein
VKGRDPIEQPKVAARWMILSSEMLIGIIMDLEKLTFKPVGAEKELSRAYSLQLCP